MERKQKHARIPARETISQECAFDFIHTLCLMKARIFSNRKGVLNLEREHH